MLYETAAHFVMLVVCLIQLLLTKLTESVTTIDVSDLFPGLEGCGHEQLWSFGFCRGCFFLLVLQKESVATYLKQK